MVTYTIESRKATLEALPHERLVAQIINGELNDFVSRHADVAEGEDDPSGGHKKRVPYIGWYWRNVDFVAGDYSIGHCGDFVGFMENNKWDYPERRLVPEEAAQVTAIVCDAHEISCAGGVLSDIIAATQAKLGELWSLLQSFPMDVEGFWIRGVQGIVGFAKTGQEADEFVAMLQEAGQSFPYEKVPASAGTPA